MTYIIAEPCIDIKDLSCVDVCPVDCIHQAERILVIDPEECIDCGACEPECPVEAIFPEDALPEKWDPFIKINYAYGDGMDVGRWQPRVQASHDITEGPTQRGSFERGPRDHRHCRQGHLCVRHVEHRRGLQVQLRVAHVAEPRQPR